MPLAGPSKKLMHYKLLGAECGDRVDGCGALRRDDAGEKGAESEGESSG